MSRAERKAAKKAYRAAHRWTGKDRLKRLGWATLAGVMTFLAFPFQTVPDTNLWPLAWVSLVPLLWALRGTADKPTTDRQGFWIGAWMGFVTNFGGFWWISEVLFNFGHLPWFVSWPLTALNAFYQGLMWALVAWWWVRARRRGEVPIWKLAAIFAVVEWLFPMIFPWYLSNSQYRFLPAIQIAELGGVMAITFMIVAFNGAVFAVLDHKLRQAILPRRAAILAFAGTALAIVYGVVRIAMVDSDIAAADKFKLGLVEANIGIFEKQAKHLSEREQALTLHRNLLLHQKMSQEVANAGADLVVWPESSYFPVTDPFIKRGDELALGLDREGRLYAQSFGHAGWVARADATTSPLRALAAVREDAWAGAGEGGYLAIDGEDVATGITSRLNAVAMIEAPGYSAHDDGAPVVVWAAGDNGQLVRVENGKVTNVPSGTTTPLRAISLGSGRTGWAVGDNATALRIDRDTIRPLALDTTANLRAVWADPYGGGALIAGANGLLTFVDNDGEQSRQLVPELADVTFTGIAADAFDVIHVGGSRGVVIARRDKVWTRDDLPVPDDIAQLGTDARFRVIAVTGSGKTWRRDPERWVELSGAALVAVAPMPYVQARPLPRDVRYVWQSNAPLPADIHDASGDVGDTRPDDRVAIQRGFKTPILLGGLTWEPAENLPSGRDYRLYNTAMLIDGEGRVLGTYDKVFLLAFGEFMPFGDFLKETFGVDLYKAFPTAGRFSPGSEVKTFRWGERTLGVMICYEDIMAGFTSKLADLEPGIIINVTNDAWFGRTSEPYLHLALSVFRSIENRRMLVRSTNTGVSAFIDPTGRITGQTRIDDPEVLIQDVPVLDGVTVYGVVGDLFVWTLAAALLIEGVWAWRRRVAARKVAA